MGGLSPFHMLIVFLVVLIIFGPKSIPQIAKAFGKGIREFKEAARGMTADVDDDPPRRTVTQAPAVQLPPVNSEGHVSHNTAQEHATGSHQA